MFRLEFVNNIAVFHLDAPPVNAMTFSAWSELPALVGLAEARDVQAMVFSGRPQKHFCGGNDVREFETLSHEGVLDGVGYVQAAMRAISDSRIPAVAALHGAVMGSGLILASACDVRVATRDARLALPEVKVGAYGGYALASKLLPHGIIRAMTLSGTPIDGQRAFDIGYVQELALDADACFARALALAEEFGKLLGGELGQEIKHIMSLQDSQDKWTAYETERAFAAKIMGAGHS